jgi:hypothetical protein
MIGWLFTVLVLRLAQEYVTLCMETSPLPVRATKFRLMLGTHGLWAGKDLLWHGASVFPVSSEGPPHLVAFYDTFEFWNCVRNLWQDMNVNIFFSIDNYFTKKKSILFRGWGMCHLPRWIRHWIFKCIHDLRLTVRIFISTLRYSYPITTRS